MAAASFTSSSSTLSPPLILSLLFFPRSAITTPLSVVTSVDESRYQPESFLLQLCFFLFFFFFLVTVLHLTNDAVFDQLDLTLPSFSSSPIFFFFLPHLPIPPPISHLLSFPLFSLLLLKARSQPCQGRRPSQNTQTPAWTSTPSRHLHQSFSRRTKPLPAAKVMRSSIQRPKH